MGDMGMDHGRHGSWEPWPDGSRQYVGAMDHGGMQGGMAGMDHSPDGGMDLFRAAMAGMAGMARAMQGTPPQRQTTRWSICRTHDTNAISWNDPGIGLRDNGPTRPHVL